MIVAGDIGGTKTVVASFARVDGRLERRADAIYASREYAGLAEILEEFLHRQRIDGLEAACFGVAGVVSEGRASTTNLPWQQVDEAGLSAALGGVPVALVNDLEAAAHGMLKLPAEDFVSLNPDAAAPRTGHIAVLAAGTGLGEALLVWDGERHLAIATEGGHADFAPRSDEEIELLRFLRARYGHVSWERVVSGPGLSDLYRFARERSGEPEPGELAQRLAGGDPSAAISEEALRGGDAVCRRALALFVSLYAAEAGNLALKSLALGGVLLGGGIAPKILPALRAPEFMQAFAAKGRFGELLRSLPVRVVTNPWAPLVGAAHRAADL